MLYEMLTGRRPFEGDEVTDVLAAVVRAEPDWTALPSTTPPLVRRLLKRCLTKDVKQRLHDIADARLDIDEAAAASADGASGVGAGTSRTNLWSRRRGLAVAVVTLCCGLAIGGLAIWRFKPEPTTRGVRSVIDLPAGTQLTRATEGPSPGPVNLQLAAAPDGKSVVFSASPDGSVQKALLYSRPLDAFEAVAIPGTEGASSPFFSPDGQWLGFWAAGQLKKWSMVGGGIPAVIAEVPGVRQGATWGADGTIVLGTDAGGLRAIDAAGNVKPLTKLVPGEEAAHVLPSFLPGGRTLLFTVKPHSWGTRSHIETLSLDTIERRVLLDGADARFVPTGHVVYMAQGMLMAVPFDATSLKTRGRAVPVVQHVQQALNALAQIYNSGAGQFVLSGSGTLVYAPGGMFPDIETHVTWVDQDGNKEPIAPLDKKPILSLRLSPDGRYLAYRTVGVTAEVWVLDLVAGTSRRITSDGRSIQLAWTNDGRRLTFGYSLAGDSNIFWKAADGSGPEQPEMLVRGEHALYPSAWSPDDKMLLFVEANPKSGNDIWVYRVGEGKTPLFNADYNEEYPAISKDGNWLAYCSTETGRSEVYVTSMSNPAKGTPITSGGGVAPLWAPDGRTIYYWNPDWTELMRIDIRTGASIKFEGRRKLFTFPATDVSWVRAYDLDRDGKRFLIVGRAEPKATEVTRLNLVLNWFEELKAKVPSGR